METPDIWFPALQRGVEEFSSFIKKTSPDRRADNHINSHEISQHSTGRSGLLDLLSAIEDVTQTP